MSKYSNNNITNDINNKNNTNSKHNYVNQMDVRHYYVSRICFFLKTSSCYSMRGCIDLNDIKIQNI